MNKNVRTIISIVLLLAAVPMLMAGGKKESAGPEEKQYPFTEKSLVQILDSRSELSFMAEALRETGLAEQMAQLDGYTIFIPTDDVIARLPERLRQALKTNPQALLDVLTAQMVKGIVPAEELEKRNSVLSMNDKEIKIGRRGNRISVAESDLIEADLFGRGFVVHIVTGIIVPEIKL